MSGFTIDADGAARIFVESLKTVPDDSDALRLGEIIRLFIFQARRATIEKAKAEFRSRHSGFCRMPSQGNNCNCFLCALDKLHEND